MYNQIYNITNEFVKSLTGAKCRSFLVKNWNGKRGPKRRLSLEKVIALNLLRFFLHIKDLKAFHRIIKTTDLIPEMPKIDGFSAIKLHQSSLQEENRLKDGSTDSNFMESVLRKEFWNL